MWHVGVDEAVLDGRVSAAIFLGSSYDNSVDIDMAVYARNGTNGSAVTGWGSSGLRSINFSGDDTFRGLALAPDGKLAVAGGSGGGDFAVARLTITGKSYRLREQAGKKVSGKTDAAEQPDACQPASK